MKYNLYRRWITLLCIIPVSFFILFLTGCSGGGDDVAQTPNTAQAGTFIDSPVEGMQYLTPSWSGYTDSHGGYYYQKGEKVKFYIGGIYFGKATATGLMTPLTLGGIDELTSEDTNVISMSRILLTLDQDRNPDNGITIPRQLSVDLAGVNLNLTDPTLVLDNNPEVNEMLEILTGSDVTAEEHEDLLVSSVDAQIHLENTINNVNAEAEGIQETLENMTPVATISSPSGNIIMIKGQSLNFQGSVYGGKSPYTFSWNFLGEAPFSTQQSPGVRNFNTLGNSYIHFSATDTSGKTGESQRFITVLESKTQEGPFPADSIPTVTITYPAGGVPIRTGDTVFFMAKLEQGDTPLIYNWTLGAVPGNSLSPRSEKVECISPRTYIITQGIQLNSPGTYEIKINVKDTNTGGRYPDTHTASIGVTVN